MVEKGGGLSILQKEVLLSLKKVGSIPTITSLAAMVGRLRPSVSRSVHKLIDAGLVTKNGRLIELTPTGLEVAKDIKVFKRVRDGSFSWIDDECAGWKCACGKYTEDSILVSIDDPTECDGCGRRYILRQRTWVEEVVE